MPLVKDDASWQRKPWILLLQSVMLKWHLVTFTLATMRQNTFPSVYKVYACSCELLVIIILWRHGGPERAGLAWGHMVYYIRDRTSLGPWVTLLSPTPSGRWMQVNSNNPGPRRGAAEPLENTTKGPHFQARATASPSGILLMGEKGACLRGLNGIWKTNTPGLLEHGPAPATNSHPVSIWGSSVVPPLSTTQPRLNRELARPGRRAALC